MSNEHGLDGGVVGVWWRHGQRLSGYWLTTERRAAIRYCCDVFLASQHGYHGLHMIMGGELSLDGNEDIIHHYIKQLRT